MNRGLSIALLALFALCSVAGAMKVGGIELPPSRNGLELHGAGLLRKGFIFKIYVGALYLEDSLHSDRVLSDVPKRIDIHYFHNTPKKLMIGEANKTLMNNLTEKEYGELLPKIGKLHEAFRDGKKGSYASLVFSPGKGLAYLFDGEPLLTIDCDRFANAYFKIWLGEKPSSRSIKKAMLEGDKG